MSDLPELTEFEREVYSWQTTVTGFGEEGQLRLKGATVMISRVGGLGGLVAYELAAAGVGRLVLAHGGNLKPSDLNRQLLMRHDALGQARIGTAVETLKALNPRLEIVAVPENVSEANADDLVTQSDVVVDCAPLFEERFAMNAACMRLSSGCSSAASSDEPAARRLPRFWFWAFVFWAMPCNVPFTKSSIESVMSFESSCFVGGSICLGSLSARTDGERPSSLFFISVSRSCG